MRLLQLHTVRALLALAGAAALWAAASPRALATPEPTQQIMQRVRASLAALLPLTLSEGGWEKAEPQEPTRAALRELASAAEQLAQHAGPEPESFGYLSRSLAGDARAIQRRVREGRYGTASYLTQRLTETCIACHSRLPAHSAAQLESGLTHQVDTALLAPLSRVRLQLATRQFDAALGAYEAQFESSATSASALEPELPSYLITALRVLRDPQRAQRGLSLLAQRGDLSAALAQNLQTWRSAIRDSASALAEPPSIARARALLAQGRALCEFPADGADLAHAVIASSIAFRLLEEKHPRGQERAEAFYLLGQTESFTRRAFEISDAEHYLEEAIRADPHTPLAARAYARLEETLRLGYTGSSGEHVPPDVEQHLAELRELSLPLQAPGANGTAPSPPQPAQRRD